jgi:methylglutaconyl-CoA hydratase
VDHQFVTYSVKDRVGFITLDRADKRNALNSHLISELKELFEYAEKDESCKVIVLQAKGDVFSAGADLEYLQSLQSFSRDENIADSNHLMGLFKQIYYLKKVVIASVQGHAIAGGCGLASVCDLSIASESAKFGYSEVKIGFIPAIVSVFLLRKIGEGKTKELLLTGKTISAQQATNIGLINSCVPKENLEQSVLDLAQKLCATASADSLRSTKLMLAEMQNLSLDEGLDLAVNKNAMARESEDCKKGIDAFLNKKNLNW